MVEQRVKGIQVCEGVETHSSVSSTTFDCQCSDVVNSSSAVVCSPASYMVLSTRGVFWQICPYRSVLRLVEHINGYSDFESLHSDFFELFSGQ